MASLNDRSQTDQALGSAVGSYGEEIPGQEPYNPIWDGFSRFSGLGSSALTSGFGSDSTAPAPQRFIPTPLDPQYTQGDIATLANLAAGDRGNPNPMGSLTPTRIKWGPGSQWRAPTPQIIDLLLAQQGPPRSIAEKRSKRAEGRASAMKSGYTDDPRFAETFGYDWREIPGLVDHSHLVAMMRGFKGPGDWRYRDILSPAETENIFRQLDASFEGRVDYELAPWWDPEGIPPEHWNDSPGGGGGPSWNGFEWVNNTSLGLSLGGLAGAVTPPRIPTVTIRDIPTPNPTVTIQDIFGGARAGSSPGGTLATSLPIRRG